MPRDAREFVVGDRVPGTKWVVRGKLGEGGMGLVLDVVKEPGIPGAMKVMLPDFAKRPEFVARFFDEVRLLAQLRHPNIVQVFDFDQLDDGTPYVVMERLLGVTLRAGLRNLRERGTPISAKLIYEVTRQLCEGLFRAHSNTPAIVHRDVKPENIFFHQPEFADTIVKVIDFGIAAVLDGTRDRRVFGTPRHMAPEQLRGEAVSPATDVYAAALVLYELLTGRFPWEVDLRDELALVEAHLHRPPEPPSTYTRWVPPLVDQWILRALCKHPKNRPQDAYEFIAKLYQLQFVNDGTSDSVVDINTTAPTLASLAEAVEEAIGAQTNLNDSVETSRSMTPPPIEGASLEVAPSELAGNTDPMRPPTFSEQNDGSGGPCDDSAAIRGRSTRTHADGQPDSEAGAEDRYPGSLVTVVRRAGGDAGPHAGAIPGHRAVAGHRRDPHGQLGAGAVSPPSPQPPGPSSAGRAAFGGDWRDGDRYAHCRRAFAEPSEPSPATCPRGRPARPCRPSAHAVAKSLVSTGGHRGRRSAPTGFDREHPAAQSSRASRRARGDQARRQLARAR
jgi:serine/threonine protein kinase